MYSSSHGLANGFGKGLVAGVAGLGAASAHGVAGLGHGVADRARGLTIKRTKSSRARKRQSELNIFGDSDIVSADYTIEKLQESKKNPKVTKLELEDIIHRDDGRHAEVFEAVKDMLKEDGGREWKYVKFIDSIRIGDLGEEASYIRQYEAKRLELWNSIENFAKGKPIMFEVKLEVEEETAVRCIIELLTEIQRLDLAKVTCMGGLLGVPPHQLGDVLTSLCKPEFGENVEDDGELSEMIMFSLDYVNDTTGVSKKDLVWKKALRRCVNRLKGKSNSSSGDTPGSQLGVMRAAASSTSTRSFSPRRDAVRVLSGDLKSLSKAMSTNKLSPERKLLHRGTAGSISDGHLLQKQHKPSKISSNRSIEDRKGNSRNWNPDEGPAKPARIKRAVTSPVRSRKVSPTGSRRSPDTKGSPKEKAKVKVKRVNSSKKNPSYDWDKHGDGKTDSAVSA